ncbi:PLAT/LH2 domain-containing protein [Ditylenchus destructor]|nr:PLAT/LH2 domain-containing protein [Ditylenchus destructor]
MGCRYGGRFIRYSLWGHRPKQNQSDTFQVDLPTKLGVIGRLTVGHEHTGYGAGIFIDRILVTEENVNETQSGRQFLFLCNKWLDSGQVDGKIERNIRLSAFYDIGSLPTENQATKGRWELIIHSGNAKGEGGTTSSLSIIGYGTRGHSKTTDIYDSRMAKVPSEALIQVDFGDIGELLKIRLEVDGNGDSPDYFLNFVELKDLDTEEQFAVMCGKWLRWNSSEKGTQSFRELLAFHVGVEPLPLISYEGKLRLAPSKIQFTESLELRMELYGDLGETGFVRLFFDENNNNLSMNDVKDGKIDIPFKLESVSIGRVYGARLSFDPTPLGESIYEGLATLQEIYQRSLPDVQPFDTGNSWLVSHAILRESTHTPYRYVLKQNRVHRSSDQSQSCIKELLTTEMEGISTRVNKKKIGKRLESNWILSMAISDSSTFLPVVTLCGEKKVSMEMRNLDPTPTDNIISYQLKSSKVGTLRKIRIAVGKEKLKVPPVSQQTPNRSYAGDYVGIHKIRLCDTANGDELRFPSAEVDLFQHSVYEFSAIFPDQPPIPIVVYGIRVATSKSTVGQSPASDILIRLSLNGEMGDIGQRALVPDPLEMDGSIDIVALQSSFKENAHANFEIEAVSIGEISSAEVTVEWLKGGKHKELTWECEEIVVTDSNTSLFYAFKFPKPFTSKLTQQTTSVLPFLNAL